jgi:acetyl-CoA hydrolase
VPGASVGATPEILASAEKIIIEVNTSLPSFKGLHDVRLSLPSLFSPPFLPLLGSPFSFLQRHISDVLTLHTLHFPPSRSQINQSFLPPHRQPYLITHPANRIGTLSIPVDPARVVAIVESKMPDVRCFFLIPRRRNWN